MDEDQATKDPLIKEQRIKKEFNRIKRIFKNIPKTKMDTVLSLIRNAAFMTITLEDLQETINREGAVSEYKNGENQFGTKKSPEVEIYNTMVKNLASIIKQLTDLLPPGTPPPPKELDQFEKLLTRGRGQGGS